MKPTVRFCLLLLLVVSLLDAQQSVLDSLRQIAVKNIGSITGITQHVDSKERLPFVNLLIKGTSIGTSSNVNGEFTLMKVPAGMHTLIVSSVGHRTIELTVNVEEGKATNVIISLENESVQMNEILVYGASLKKERITEAPAAISVVEGKGLQRGASSGQLPKLLEGQPGVDLVQSGLYDFNLNTRGFNSSLNRRVLILLDGRDLGTAFLSSTEWNGMSTPLEDLGRVEMVRGPGSALYGANAYNGVLNITSTPPKAMLGTKVTAGVGELSMFRGDVRHSGQYEHYSYRINMGGVTGKTFSKTRTRSITGSRQQDIYNAATNGAFQDQINNNQKFEYESFSGLNKEVAEMRDDPVSQFYLSGRLDHDYEWGGSSTVEGGITQVENEVIVTGIGRVQVQRARRPFARLSYSDYGFNVNVWTQSRINMAPEVSLSTGLDLVQDANMTQGEVQYNRLFFDNQLFVVAGLSHRLISIDTKNTLMLGKRDDNTTGIFGQLEYRFATELKAVVAGRYDRSSLHESFFSPKAAIVFSPDANHNFRATYNKAFQSPNYSELYLYVNHPYRGFTTFSATTASGLAYRGNRYLKVEKIEGVELGYNGVIENSLFLTVDLYYNRLKDFISDLGAGFGEGADPVNLKSPTGITRTSYRTGADTVFSHAVWSYKNVGKVYEYGYDIGVNYYLTEEIIFDANYTYFQFEIDTNSVTLNERNQIQPNSPRWKTNVGVTYQSKNYDIALKVKYVPPYFWSAGVFAGQIKAYALVTLSGGYQVNESLSMNLNISNLLDREHYEIFGGSLLGRRSVLTATYSF
ncbi:MAG: TonB-dependent receptor [Ignavibacteriales bacterium]|nr:TonB-dependent receptor [Ignavibacteriales bacterium]